MKYISRFAVPLKRLGLFALTIVVIVLVVEAYITLIPNVWYRDHAVFSLIGIWLLTAYFVLPRMHRFLTKIYLPPYFSGRARTSDGLLGDPVNLAVNGNKKALFSSMKKAGWQKADDITLKTAWRTVYCSVFRKSYPNAPVSDLFVFGNKQDVAFQKEVNNNPRKRHHVRFWRVPKDWYLPGGYKVDWIGAATYDDTVGFSLFTMQVTHSIDANVDKERDFLIDTLRQATTLKSSTKIEHFFNAYKTRNGGGHSYITDGSFVIADLIGESPSRSTQAMQHANLESIQEELYNLRLAQDETASILPNEEIAKLEQTVQDIKRSLKNNANTDRIADKAADLLIGSVLLHESIDKKASATYRRRVDRHWDKQQKQDSDE